MELIILDNGLVDRGTHSYNIAAALRDELQRRGTAYRLFAPRSADPEVVRDTGAMPYFRHSLYDSIKRPRFRQPSSLLRRSEPGGRMISPIQSEIATFKTLNRDYRRDLARLPNAWKPENIVLVVGLSQNELMGLVRHLRLLPPAECPAVICSLLFGPSWTSWGAEAIRGANHYAKIFELAAPLLGRSLFLATETAGLADYYRSAFGIDADPLPIPLAFDAAARRPRLSNGKPTLGYFGYSKTAKGFHLLPQAIESCRARGLAAEFLVHVQHSRWEPAVIAAEAALDRLTAVSLVKGQLNRGDYYSLFDRVDAVLLPYDPAEYGVRGSNVLFEAILRGLPVVASAGTWAASLISRGEAAGEIIAPVAPEGVVDAVERLIARREEIRDRAAAAAARFAAAHSPSAYVSAILDMARRKAGGRETSGGP